MPKSTNKIDEILASFQKLKREKDKMPSDQYVHELEILKSDLIFYLTNPEEHKKHEINLNKLLGDS